MDIRRGGDAVGVTCTMVKLTVVCPGIEYNAIVLFVSPVPVASVIVSRCMFRTCMLGKTMRRNSLGKLIEVIVGLVGRCIRY